MTLLLLVGGMLLPPSWLMCCPLLMMSHWTPPTNSLTSCALHHPAVYGEIEFDCGHWGVFENAIDMAHIHYLHSDR